PAVGPAAAPRPAPRDRAALGPGRRSAPAHPAARARGRGSGRSSRPARRRARSARCRPRGALLRGGRMIGKPGAACNSGTMGFEPGDRPRPRGHALLYFRDPQEAVRVWATYLVVPPIAMDIGKYVPPLLAAQLPQGLGALGGMPSVYPLPPFPEAVQSQD